MDIHFVSIHPKFIEAYWQFGTFKSAQDKNLANLYSINLRDFAVDKHGSVDSRPYGGGDGMVLRPEPLANAVKAIPNNPYVILTSPRGKIWQQSDAERLRVIGRPLVFICGRFGGVDERFIENYADEEISIGNFILSGGELAALSVCDSILRLVPGVLGHEESSQIDSFSKKLGGQLEHSLFTKPPVFEDREVPPILLSGHHKAIEDWRLQESQRLTKKHRPDLI
jgi:tRNA (guanine37-N1)-methyltransferase